MERSRVRPLRGSVAIADRGIEDSVWRFYDAIRLTQLGARAALVCRLTGIPKASAKRLWISIHDQPSPPGQSPYSDAWYVQSDQRMLQAMVIWLLNRQLGKLGRRPAHHLISLYESYLCIVANPLFDLTRAQFVLHLEATRIWCTRTCMICETPYIGPVEDMGKICAGCKLHRLHRCAKCGSVLRHALVGRKATVCRTCKYPR